MGQKIDMTIDRCSKEGNKCPLKETCFRYNSKVAPGDRTSDFHLLEEAIEGKCEIYWENLFHVYTKKKVRS